LSDVNGKRPEAPGKAYTLPGISLVIAVLALIAVVLVTGMAYGVLRMTGGEVDEGVFKDGVREFEISGGQWSYKPKSMKVEPGDRVRFVISSRDITHGFAINELGINRPLYPQKQTIEVVIPADMDDATHTLYCSIFCGIGHPYMKAPIIVGEPGFEIGKFLPYAASLATLGLFAASIMVWRPRR